MKNKHVLVFMFSLIVFSANALFEKGNKKQDKQTETVEGTFDGYDKDDGYVFLVKGEENEMDTMYFTEITKDALKMFDLKSKDMIGKLFLVTYEIEEFEEEDEEGDIEVYEKYTITKLEKL